MHELSVVMQVIDTMEKYAKENKIEKIETLVLQIGELSSMIPSYVEACYPVAVDGTFLQDTELKIEVIPGNALCKDCDKVFNVKEHHGICPTCGTRKNLELLSGKEFFIKEIVAC